MSKILVNIPYLEGSDVNDDGSINLNGTVVLMIQGNFCGYCTQAKPAFQNLSKSLPNGIICATVQMDGQESDKEASRKLSVVNKSPGVPSFLGFKNGKFVKMHTGGRDEASLLAFAQSL